MDKRKEKLLELNTYIEGVDKEITMILQSLQWDRKHLLQGSALVSCKYDVNHRVPPDQKGAHEEECLLRSQGYAKEDRLLPDPWDESAPTLIKFTSEDIAQIISKAAQNDPSFKRGCTQPAPLTAERLQATFTADERRAIHDAAVSAAPVACCVEDLALPGADGEGKQRPKSKLEVLAELRDMRRRRTKYRGASAASKNYSNVLRDVIKTQMELFTGVKDDPQDSLSKPVNNTSEQLHYKHNYDTKDNGRGDRHGKHGDEYKTERYEGSSRSRDKRNYDGYKEKHRNREDKEKDSNREKYGNDTSKNDKRSREKHFKKERESVTKYYDEENGHSNSKCRAERERDDARRHSDKYSSRNGSYRDASESRSDRSYKSEKHGEPRSSKKSREAYHEKYKDSRNTKSRRDHEDTKYERHREKKREEDKTHDAKHRAMSKAAALITDIIVGQVDRLHHKERCRINPVRGLHLCSHGRDRL